MAEEKNVEEKLSEIQDLMKYLSVKAPENMGSFGSFVETIQKDGKLSLKMKELISIALSLSSQCEWCIPY
ncbi:MAG: carboxymuconolactone decarboxylase family protein, partial [Thermoplasmataceae archaeon]